MGKGRRVSLPKLQTLKPPMAHANDGGMDPRPLDPPLIETRSVS